MDGSSATDRIDVNDSLVFGATAALDLIDLGGRPQLTDEYVLFNYAGDDPVNPAWTIYSTAAPHWDISQATVFVDPVGNQVVLTGLDYVHPADFNNDDNLDGMDIDALVMEIVAGTNDLQFDLTGDGIVDRNDLQDADLGWLRLAGEENLGPGLSYLEGDANVDGFVDGVDFVAWNENKFTSQARWTKGDFNADGAVDGQDFVIWNSNKFSSSASKLVVPEPTSVWLVVPLAALTTERVRRPRRAA